MSISLQTRRTYAELEQRLRPFIARRVPVEDVEDVLQDVFLRMQQGLTGLREQERLIPWAYQVARSAVSESHRKQHRNPLATAATEEELSADGEGIEPSAMEAELAAYVTGLISALPSPYREALSLTELEGLTQKAAADMLGISLSGMKSRVQRGRDKLRELVDACCQVVTDARGRVIECAPRSKSDCRCRN